ncbi:MAG: hypothetical protein K2X11_18415, partial [Acetobacteraceae bacterium]|nr:hypothetical protein [Acetobacteraceae bacterium]
ARPTADAADRRTLRWFVAGEGALLAQGPEALEDLTWRAEARDGRDRSAIRALLPTLDWPVFPVQGRDVLALGVAPGIGVGRLLSALRSWWVEETRCDASREECLARLAQLAKAPPG